MIKIRDEREFKNGDIMHSDKTREGFHLQCNKCRSHNTMIVRFFDGKSAECTLFCESCQNSLQIFEDVYNVL